MAKKTRARTKRVRPTAAHRATSATVKVAAWEDDPGDPMARQPLVPISVVAPNQSAQPLPFKINGRMPSPKVYQPGTSQFRYYTAAAALRRTANFWGRIAPKPIVWQVGSVLPIVLDEGVDLNAFYTRGGFGESAGLHFFHAKVAGRTFFSGESPDIVSHEMGHAVLDAIRPQLFDVQTIEAAAFHESFGDMSAMLSALQVESFRQVLIGETAGALGRSSRLSRLAEQLGAAIRAQHPDAVDPDCLRNAANSFFYRDPQTLPPSAPASQLSSEPHSFSRVFTAAFLELLAGVVRTKTSAPTEVEMLAASEDAGRLLFAAIQAAPIVPDYFSQVAAHMIDAGERAPFNGKYRDALKSAFTRRGILSLRAAVTITGAAPSRGRRLADTPLAALVDRRLPLASISGAQYGLDEPVLKVFTAEEPKQFGVTSSSINLGPVEPRSPQNAAESFTEDLFQRGRIDIRAYGDPRTRLVHLMAKKTHVLVRESGSLILKRRTFDCGFD